MKLKYLPEDFLVEERHSVSLSPTGEFGFYSLHKTNLGTPEALETIAKTWKRPFEEFSFGGLKDRHAITTQFFTLRQGPKTDLDLGDVRVRYLGQVEAAFDSESIDRNHFRIAVRDLSTQDVERAKLALSEMHLLGVANYFDDQRFGSVGTDGRFIAREMIAGKFEEALKLALCSPNEVDRATQRREKEILRRHWGDWKTCQQASSGSARKALSVLRSRPNNFPEALSRLNPELQGMYLGAYQSHLWNRVLARWIAPHAKAKIDLELKLGAFPTPSAFDETEFASWNTLEIPLPSARIKIREDDPIRPLLDAVLAEDGLTLETMQVPAMRKPFFAKGLRSARLLPENLSHRSSPDEHHPGREKLDLEFDLPRGAYATMIVKRITSH